MEVMRVENLQKFYGKKGTITKALKGINFEVEKGEYIAIMGASGSGKTTLLNCISTIDTPTGGHVYIENKEITTLKKNQISDFRRKKLGFVFQDFHLLDTLTAYENISLPLTIKKEKLSIIEEKVNEVAKLLNISDVLNKFPYQMSGGQRQRVASARAIITNPSIVMADEPTGALDTKSAKMLLDSFKILNEEKRATIIMVTHDAFVASHCKRILFIRDGKLFNELIRGNETRKQFFEQILACISLLSGGVE